ncbi:MAG: GyrI-like domain-containing protein [Acidimicrobiales bacterium]
MGSEPAHPDQPTIAELGPASLAVIHAVVPMAQLPAFFDAAFTELAAVLAEQGLTPAGPAFAHYHAPPAGSAVLDVGFPVAAEIRPQGRVQPATRSASPAATLVHQGPYDGLGSSWERLAGWIAEQGLTPTDELWEIYETEPTPDLDPNVLRTVLFWPLRT